MSNKFEARPWLIIFGSPILVPLLMIVGAPIALANGLAIFLLWKWFVVPLGVPELGYLQAVGFDFLFSMIPYVTKTRNEFHNKSALQFAMELFRPFYFIAFGYLIQRLM